MTADCCAPRLLELIENLRRMPVRAKFCPNNWHESHDCNSLEAVSRESVLAVADELSALVREQEPIECPNCEGDGFAPFSGGNCERCHGSGKIKQEQNDAENQRLDEHADADQGRAVDSRTADSTDGLPVAHSGSVGGADREGSSDPAGVAAALVREQEPPQESETR